MSRLLPHPAQSLLLLLTWLLLVDSIADVVDVDVTDFEAPPDTLEGQARDLIRGAYKLRGQLLLALDVQKAVSA